MRPRVFEPRLLLAATMLFAAGCLKRQARVHSLEADIVATSLAHPERAAGWEETIRDLAHRYEQQERTGHLDAEKGRRAKQALDQGCQDPFVRYLWLDYQAMPCGTKPTLLFAEAKAVAEELYANGYPQYLRAGAADFALRMSDYTPTEADEAARKPLHDIQWKSSFGGINNPAVPEWEARALADDLGVRWMYSNPSGRERTDAEIDAAIVKRFGEGATLHYLRGARAVRRAWRISDPGHTKTAEWHEYTRELSLARGELEQAWQAEPRHFWTACYMIGVCQGLNLPRKQMEQWFQRALATGFDGSYATDAKLDYLGDRELGSIEDRVAFGREALVHPEYGWDARLKLWLAHWRQQTWGQLHPDYLAQPAVWQDIKESISTYLAIYPEAQAIRLHYAYHAWLARDWPVFREQFAQIDPARLDLKLIGGPNAVDAMREDFQRTDPLPSAPRRPGDL